MTGGIAAGCQAGNTRSCRIPEHLGFARKASCGQRNGWSMLKSKWRGTELK